MTSTKHEANREKARAYYEANREKIKAYRAANREKRKAYMAAYRMTNREKIKAYGAAYRPANREKQKAYSMHYRAANREKIRGHNVAYRAANRDKAIRMVAIANGTDVRCHYDIHPHIPDELKSRECWGQLQFEHPNGGGGRDLRENGSPIERILNGKALPKDFLLLCQLHQVWNVRSHGRAPQ